MDEIEFEDQLIDKLPSGSGINFDWNCDVNYEKNEVVCSNAYDHMNEVGMYDIVLPFQVAFPLEHPEDFELSFTGSDEQNAFAEDDQLGEYLEDQFAFAVEQDLAPVFREFSQTLTKETSKNATAALKMNKNGSREITAYAAHFEKYTAKHESIKKKLSNPKTVQKIDRIIAKKMKSEGFGKEHILRAIQMASPTKEKDRGSYAKAIYASRNQATQTL